MKQIIRTRIAERARRRQQIKAELVAQFGPAVVAEPPKSGFDLLAWLVPLGILAARRGRRRRDRVGLEPAPRGGGRRRDRSTRISSAGSTPSSSGSTR